MDVFAISPASSKPLWFIVIIGIILAAVLIVLAYTAYSSRHSRVEIARGRIKLVGDFWGRTIPLHRVEASGARIVALTSRSEFAPKRRTFGTALPGYASGWFRLRNGEKALVYLTQRREVVYVPTTDGYSLLLSVTEPERFVQLLQHYRLKSQRHDRSG